MYLKRKDDSLKDLIEGLTPESAATLIPFLPKEKIDLQLLREFLILHEDKMENNNYASYFKKLVALYDRLKFGWGSAKV